MNSRRKGSAAEREVAHTLRDHGWTDTDRLLGQARDGGPDLAPVSPSGQRYSIEVKRRQRIALLPEALEQARSGHAGVPVVWVREDQGEWLVVMLASDFMAMANLHRESANPQQGSAE